MVFNKVGLFKTNTVSSVYMRIATFPDVTHSSSFYTVTNSEREDIPLYKFPFSERLIFRKYMDIYGQHRPLDHAYYGRSTIRVL
jgi:hypothetical protein